jgi:uncharacterized protein YktB (UPF0637 family)
MEKSSQSSFLKSLALAFGDGLLFGVAMKLAQGPSKSREDEMTDLGPLAERLKKVEDHTQTIDRDALVKFGEGLDGRVLEKVIVALEARLTEHVGQVDRRLAEIDAQVALDLKAVDTHTSAQTGAVEKAIQQIEAQVRDYVAEAQQSSAEQISGIDQKLSALQDALPAKFREIIEAVRQSMEARVALELTELENRVVSRTVPPERLQELHTNLRGEVEALSSRLSTEMRDLAEHQQGQTVPLQQALQQLETKLTTLREELPPKIRQIVEAVEASMDARISAGDQQSAVQMARLEQALANLRAEMPTAGGFQDAVDESLRHHAEQVGALDQKLTVLQEELPPKIKAIVDAVRESLDARMAVELEAVEERHAAQIRQVASRFGEAQERFRQELAAESKTPALEESLSKLQADVSSIDARVAADLRQAEAQFSAAREQLRQQLAESKTPALEQSIAKLQADLAAMDSRLDTSGRQVADHLASLEQHAAQVTAGVATELESLRTEHGAKIDSAVDGLRESLEAKLAAEIHALEARTPDRSADLEKALQYASLLEARVQALEQKLQRSAEETVDRAVERVWLALENRLQQREAKAPVAAAAPPTISGLRQKSTSAEQSVLDLIAGIGQLFEKPAPRIARETPPPEAAPPAEPEPVVATHTEPPPEAPVHEEPVAMAPEHAEPEAIAAAGTPATPEPKPEAQAEPEPEAAPVAKPEPVAKAPEEPAAVPAAAMGAEEIAEPKLEEKPPVILFKPKDSGRKWRIPFVSSFLLMAAAIAWLQFM